MSAVIQEEETGCGIASVANIVQLSYSKVKAKANSLGIFADDVSLYSDTGYVRKLLLGYGVKCSGIEHPFTSWEKLPDVALLSIKYREENGSPLWHWVVYKRVDGKPVVLDSASYLQENIRTDFDKMSPRWYIEVVNI